MSNITKEGIEVKPGQVWLDLDKRTENRTVRVRKVVDGKAVCCVMVNGQAGKDTTLSIRRMHKTATGWALVSEVAVPELAHLPTMTPALASKIVAARAERKAKGGAS